MMFKIIAFYSFFYLIHISSSTEFIQLDNSRINKIEKSVFNNCTYNKTVKDFNTHYKCFIAYFALSISSQRLKIILNKMSTV